MLSGSPISWHPTLEQVPSGCMIPIDFRFIVHNIDFYMLQFSLLLGAVVIQRLSIYVMFKSNLFWQHPNTFTSYLLKSPLELFALCMLYIVEKCHLRNFIVHYFCFFPAESPFLVLLYHLLWICSSHITEFYICLL